MDIRRLVTRIADVLGPDADAAQVEALAAAALDALGPVAGAGTLPASDTPENRAIITAYGHDRPGILAAVTAAVSEAGCNILDVSQKILQGYFTLIMLADISALQGSLKDLQQRLGDVGERLGVRVMVQHEELFQSMHRP